MPAGPITTIMRDNLSINNDQPSPDGDRPNLRVDRGPAAGRRFVARAVQGRAPGSRPIREEGRGQAVDRRGYVLGSGSRGDDKPDFKNRALMLRGCIRWPQPLRDGEQYAAGDLRHGGQSCGASAAPTLRFDVG